MPIIKFSGRVFPEAANISVDPPEIAWRHDDSQVVRYRVLIIESVITVECVSDNRVSEANLSEYHRRAFDLARAAVNVVALREGEALSIIFDAWIDEEESRLPIVKGTPVSPRFHRPIVSTLPSSSSWS
jgi:hypothetical protein